MTNLGWLKEKKSSSFMRTSTEAEGWQQGLELDVLKGSLPTQSSL